MKLAAVTFTEQGKAIVDKLMEQLPIAHFCKDNVENFDLKALTGRLMQSFDGIIFVSASGIAVRAIAPFVTTKDKDPAVVVIDNSGQFVISLLSGHLGGANELTEAIASILKAQPVITTATDGLGIEAPDIIAVKNNCQIESLKRAKEISALLVKGEKVAFADRFNPDYLPSGYEKIDNIDQCSALVYITNNKNIEMLKDKLILKLIKRNIILGIGCRKGISSEKLYQFVERQLEEQNLDINAVRLISTVEIKKEEQALLDLADRLSCGIKIWTIEQIKEVEHKYEGSDFVEKILGIRAVCEPSVELAGANIIVAKAAFEGMTLCIGEDI